MARGNRHRDDDGFTLDGVPACRHADPDHGLRRAPEPKTAKNHIHWNVTVPAVAPLVAAGVAMLREPGGEIGWYVLADPEGNEFYAFTG